MSSSTFGAVTQQVSEEALDRLLKSADQDGATMMGRGFARELVYDLRAARAEILCLRSEVDRLTGWKIGAEAGADSMRGMLKTREDEITRLRSEVDDLQGRIECNDEMWNDDIAEAEAEITQHSARIAQLEAALREVHALHVHRDHTAALEVYEAALYRGPDEPNHS